MRLTLLNHAPEPPAGRLSPAEQEELSAVLWGWLSLSTGQPRSELRRDPRGPIIVAAVRSIDLGHSLQDVARLPPMVLSAVRAAAMLVHFPDSTRPLAHWLRLNQAALFTAHDLETCRELLRLNCTLEGVSGFEDEDLEALQAISIALIRYQQEHTPMAVGSRHFRANKQS